MPTIGEYDLQTAIMIAKAAKKVSQLENKIRPEVQRFDKVVSNNNIPVRIIGVRNQNGMWPAVISAISVNSLVTTTTSTTTTTTTTTTVEPTTTTTGEPATSTTVGPCGIFDNLLGGEQNAWLLMEPNDLGLSGPDDPNAVDLIVNALVVGVMPSDGLVICLRSHRCTETSSNPNTTTPAPCEGTCLWEYTFSSKTWALVSNTCGSGCVCEPPPYCPLASGDCTSTVTFRTVCSRYSATSAAPPNCTGTTTTTTTHGPCGNGCKWEFNPVSNAYYRIETETYFCNSPCNCSPPTGIPTDKCGEFFTPCIQPTTTACGGYCTWVALANGTWALENTTCFGACQCFAPTTPPGECGEKAVTYCLQDGGVVPTTNPPPPNSCIGTCEWEWQVDEWILVKSNCPLCNCQPPAFTGILDCERTITPCTQLTTQPPVTTTTPDPCPDPTKTCAWGFYITNCRPLAGFWALVESNCSQNGSPCNPLFPPYGGGIPPGLNQAIINDPTLCATRLYPVPFPSYAWKETFCCPTPTTAAPTTTPGTTEPPVGGD